MTPHARVHAADVDAPPSFVDFARRAAAAGVIPDLTDTQLTILAAFDGGEVRLVDAATARRANRRLMRTVIAACALAHGERVTFVGDDPERALADVRDLLDSLGIAGDRHGRTIDVTQTVVTTHHDEVPAR